MMSKSLRYVLLLAVLATCTTSAWGQLLPERHHVRKGNRLYEEQRMEEAQREYREALQVDSLSSIAKFNLGDTHYAMGDFEAAEESFRRVAEQGKGLTPEEQAKVYYNLGNAQFQQQKLQEALESYKSSLKLNPNDLEAKFNYAYTKAMLENQQNQDQNQNQNQDQNQQQEQQQNQNQNNNEQDNKSQEQQQSEDEQQPKGEKPEDPEEEKPEPSEEPEDEPRERPEPKAESQQMLDAVQAAEDKTREKVDGEKATVMMPRSGKNW